MWDLNLYSSMLSLMIIPRTVETKSEEIVFVLSEEEISHLTSYHILHACIGKVFLQCVW